MGNTHSFEKRVDGSSHWGQGCDFLAVDPHRAFAWLLEPCDDRNRVVLPATRRPQAGKKLPVADVQVYNCSSALNAAAA